METVQGLADSGVKFFDQGVAFQINALVNIREGVKKLSNELKEVVKEKELLQQTVTKLKGEKDILEKLLKKKLQEDKQTVAMHNCLIVTDKFARSITTPLGSSSESQQNIQLGNEAVQELVRKVREAHDRQSQQSGQPSSSGSSHVPANQPSFLSMSTDINLENTYARDFMNTSDERQSSVSADDRGTNQESIPLQHRDFPTSNLNQQTNQTSRSQAMAMQPPLNQPLTMQPPLGQLSIPKESNLSVSDPNDSCTVYITPDESGQIPEVIDITIKTESTPPYEEDKMETELPENTRTEESENIGQTEFVPQVEEPYVVTPAEPPPVVIQPMEPTASVYIMNPPMSEQVTTMPEPTQVVTPVARGRPTHLKQARTSWRGLESRRSNTPIHIRRGGGIIGSPTMSGSISSRISGGQRVMVPKYRSSLYGSPRPSSAGLKSMGATAGIKSTGASPGTSSASSASTSQGAVPGTSRGYDDKGRLRRFVCDMCGKVFPTKQAVQRHLRSHTGEKPFQCPECMQLFSQKSSLDRHRRLKGHISY